MIDVAPASPESISAGWLTDVLMTSGFLPSGVVKTIEAEVVGEGQGFASRIYRLNLSYEGEHASAPESVVAKFYESQSDEAGLMTFDTEVRFYNDLAPTARVRTPQCYYAASDRQVTRILLLLQDLREERIGDILSGCTPKDALLVAESMAAFHARWWETPELDRLDWIPRSPFAPLDNTDSREIWAAKRQNTWDNFAQLYGSVIPSSIRQAWDALGEYGPQVRSRFLRLPAGLCHGDFRLDNLCFSRAEVSRPPTVFDWQTIHKGAGLPMCDLGLFVSTSLEPAIRREVEQTLIQTYSARLGENGVFAYGPEQCATGYQLGLYEQFQAFVYVCTCMDFSSTRAQKWLQTMLCRIGSALEDHPLPQALQ